MKLSQAIRLIKNDPAYMFYYVQGNVRLFLYNHKRLRFLLRKHIIEQFEWRRDVKANTCQKAGSCICCGCETPGLFFANKECSAAKVLVCVRKDKQMCYPKMLSKLMWKVVKD